MSAVVLILRLAEVLLVLAMGGAVLRMLRGPRAQDRVLALDALNMDGVLLVLVTGMDVGSTLYIEAALIIGFLGFAATAAFAKFLLRGEVIE